MTAASSRTTIAHRADASTNRRTFLLATATTLAAVGTTVPSVQAGDDQPVALRPSGKDLFRVRIEMEFKGNVDLPKNPLVSSERSVQLPMETDAVFDYEERYRRPVGSDPAAVATTIDRFYHEARSHSTLNRNQQDRTLRRSVRDAVVRRDSRPEVIYARDDYFQRDELDLIRIPVSSVAVDEMLPTELVAAGDKYTPNEKVLLSLLNLSSVEASNVIAEVVSIDEEHAKIKFRGNVDGSIEGVPTTIRISGKLTFHRGEGICSWLAMAVHETRGIGKAEPGFDVAGTIRMIRKPLSEPVGLPSTPRPADLVGPIPADRLYVDLRSHELGFTTLMDRRWRMMSDIPGAAMMRMIANDHSIAQCDVRPLAALQPGTQLTLEAFQEDVKRTLGEQLATLVSADQELGSTGLRVLRVTAEGAAAGIPIRWVLMHLSDDSGRRMLATFTMEGKQIDTFAGADTQFANAVQFIEPSDKSIEYAARDAADSSPRATDLRALGQSIKVNSASDLR